MKILSRILSGFPCGPTRRCALGTVTDVIQTGANDVYCVSGEDGKEILLPAIKDCILKVDLEKQEMLVHVLPGLLDL